MGMRRIREKSVLAAFLGLFLKLGLSLACNIGELEYYVTDATAFPDGGYQLRPGCIGENTGPGNTIYVYPQVEHETLEGFGASLTDSSAYLIWNHPQRAEIVESLFGQSGIRIGLVRIPFGGSDFVARGVYVYQDWEGGVFSVQRDEEYILPALSAIKEANPGVKFMATPWSAPAWMKYPPFWDSTQSLNGGSFNPAFTNAYAQYLKNFLVEYRQRGVVVDYLTLQNEPLYEARGYPSMLMSPQDQANLARVLGPMIQQEGLPTKILAFDHNWSDTWFPIEALNDQSAREHIDGAAFHCYGGDFQAPAEFLRAHPDKSFFFTECSGGDWDTSYARVLRWNMHNLLIGQTRLGARGVLLWNLALDEKKGPVINNPECTDGCGCKDCRGVITVQSDFSSWKKEIEYFSIGHMSKFMQSGAKRVDSDSGIGIDRSIESVAFKNPDGSVVIIVINNDWTTGQNVNIAVNWKNYNFDLPPEGVVTFVARS